MRERSESALFGVGTATEGTYRSACGCLLHCHVDALGRARWEAEDDDGALRAVELARTARPIPLSDDPDWPSVRLRIAEPVLDPD